MKRTVKSLLLCTLIAFNTQAIAGDLDDDVGPADENLNDDIQPDVNIQFLLAKAKTRARAQANNERDEATENFGVGNIVIAPGTNLKGATIINLPDIENTTNISD